MRLPHRGKATGIAFALGFYALGSGCSRDPEIEQRPVFVYSPHQCPITENDAYSVLYASGDFESPGDTPPTADVFLGNVGQTMATIPTDTRSLIVNVSQEATQWRGMAAIPRQGPINVLVWPGTETCRLTRDVERRTDMTFGVVGHHFLVAGGRSFGPQVPHTFVGDLTTGAIERLTFGLNTRRASPSITEFRSPGDDPDAASPALVAGGHDPDSGSNGAPYQAIASAEVYVPKIGARADVGDFEQTHIELSEPRTRHGAVVLSTGETLLVGGRGPAGPLRTMEIVDPVKRRAHTAGVALLDVARDKPTVLRLANGEILVAGGVDANNNPIPTLEWFAPDASHSTKRPIDLGTGVERSFIALDAGGALAVIRPPDGTSDFNTVWVISADGTLDAGVPIDPAKLVTVRLFQGSDGSPALWTGRTWMRWSPWLGSFQPMSNAPDPTGDNPPGPALENIANGDPGLALWLNDHGDGLNVVGFRFTTRTRFDLVPKPLLVKDTAGLAPDRFVGRADSAIEFEEARGLVLGTGASAFVTDVTFADVDVEIDVTGTAPAIVLRPERGAEIEIGGIACPLERPATSSLMVKRRGTRVIVDIDGGPDLVCRTQLDPSMPRVAVGLRGSQPASSSSARNLRIVRR